MVMDCILCAGRVERCSSCRRSSCDTALCSRCRDAVPDAHPVLVPALAGRRPVAMVYLED
jgi:hypothetical protein